MRETERETERETIKDEEQYNINYIDLLLTIGCVCLFMACGCQTCYSNTECES